MPAPFPLIKLGTILFKQISKPIANFAKERAKSNLFFRTYVCMPPAQFYNWCEIKLKMWVLNLGKPINIPVLSEQMAIELGANLLGEGIVFSIAAGLLIIEYNRSSKKEAAKEAARQADINNLLYQLQELYFRVEQQDAQLREMHRLVVEISDRKSNFGGILNLKSKNSPDKPKSPPPTSPLVVPVSEEVGSESLIQRLTFNVHTGIILQAVQTIEDDIFRRGNTGLRDKEIITNAFLNVDNVVYKRPITV